VCHVAYALAKHAVKDRFVILESLISAGARASVTYFSCSYYLISVRMLHLSAPMCLKKPEFAEFLFPFLVMNVICFPDDSTITLTTAPSSTASTMSLAAYVSYNLRCDASTQFMRLNTTIVYRSAYTHSLDHSCRTYILCDANTNTESIQLTLHTLNVLRKQFMAQGEEPEESIVTPTKRGTYHSLLRPFASWF